MPTRDTATTQEIGQLYFDKVVKHHKMQNLSFWIGIQSLQVVLACTMEEIGHKAQNRVTQQQGGIDETVSNVCETDLLR